MKLTIRFKNGIQHPKNPQNDCYLQQSKNNIQPDFKLPKGQCIPIQSSYKCFTKLTFDVSHFQRFVPGFMAQNVFTTLIFYLANLVFKWKHE